MQRTEYDKKSKIWSGNPKESPFNPNVSVGQVLLMSMLNFSTKIAQINDNNGIKITYEEMYLKSIRVAENLLKMGYKKGDVIGFVSGNHHDLTPFIIAALTLGLPINVLDSVLSEAEIERLIRITNPKLIICQSHKIHEVKQAIENLNHSIKIYTFDSPTMTNDFLCETGTELLFIPPDIGNGINYPAIYICTSGTSGLPKCYTYSHAALLNNLEDAFQPVTCGDVIMTFSSFYWLSGWMSFIPAILHGCTRILTTESFSVPLLLKIIKKYKVTYLFTPPTSGAALINYTDEVADFSSLKTYLIGGSAVAMSLVEKLQEIMPNTCIQMGYGATESAGIVSRIEWRQTLNIGCILENGTKVKLLDDEGNKLGINEIGEICTWKNYNSLGYVNDTEATKEILDKDGWVHTGDCGYFDENGFLYVVDRKKDTLKYRSYPISPSEIENIIQSNININNVCVVGVPDFNCGDLPAAFIIRSKYNLNVTEEVIHKIVTDKLSDPKQLRGGVYFIEEFPLNVSGKILRRELKDLAIKLYEKK